MKKLNIKRTISASMLAGAILGGGWVYAATKVDWTPSIAEHCEFKKVTVQAGDTVSELVLKYNKDKDIDWRDLVVVFREKNGTTAIKAGEEYLVPVYKGE
jgi:cell division protein YceG involved in septum cleavage